LILEAQNIVDINNSIDINSSTKVVIDINQTSVVDLNDTNKTISLDSNVTLDDYNISIIKNENTIMEIKTSPKMKIPVYIDTTMSKFEKLFLNHLAYRDYKDAIKAMYKKDHKKAYKLAINAKKIYSQDDTSLIPLPYMPSFLRESAYSAKRIYYKTVIHKEYELQRLITKIKLLSPPIPAVVIKRTSTYIDIIVKNYGDLPLDDFEILLDSQSVVKYSKILPMEEKVYRYEKAPILHEIAFKEAYGFAPQTILMNEGY